jgi:hypothetical protein
MVDLPQSRSVAAVVTDWTNLVIDRHMGSMTTSEFLKAVRALSARYVERRADLGKRSPIDSAGKRAAFGGFFAPLHLLTALAAIARLGGVSLDPTRPIVDLGCGTGAASIALALAGSTRPPIVGVDIDTWSLGEALWNWRALGCSGRTRRANLTSALGVDIPKPPRSAKTGVIVLGWSANELSNVDRERLLPQLLTAAERGTSILVLEPLARAVVPWWGEWEVPILAAGGRSDEWKLNVVLPPRLAELDRAAGFKRDALGVRTLLLRSI